MIKIRLYLRVCIWFASLVGAYSLPSVHASAESRIESCPSETSPNLSENDKQGFDIKRIRIGDVVLYIPTRWLLPYIVAPSTGDDGPFFEKEQMFSPPLSSAECAGTLHVLNLNRSVPGLTLWASDEGNSPRLLRGGVSFINLTADQSEPGEQLRRLYDRLHHLPAIRSVKGIIAYPGSGFEEPFKPFAKSVRNDIADLVLWLSTEPAKRNNDRDFQLWVNIQ